MSNNLKFSNGKRRYQINDNESAYIEMNPTDSGFFLKIQDTIKRLSGASITGEDNSERIEKLNAAICTEIDTLFGEGKASAIFDGCAPTAVNENGDMLFEAFFEAVIKECESELKKSAAVRSKKMNSYRSRIKK